MKVVWTKATKRVVSRGAPGAAYKVDLSWFQHYGRRRVSSLRKKKKSAPPTDLNDDLGYESVAHNIEPESDNDSGRAVATKPRSTTIKPGSITVGPRCTTKPRSTTVKPSSITVEPRSNTIPDLAKRLIKDKIVLDQTISFHKAIIERAKLHSNGNNLSKSDTVRLACQISKLA